MNEFNILFPRIEEVKMDVKRGFYETINQPNKATFKYEQEGQFCLGVTKLEIKDGTMTGKRFPVFDYTENKVITIDAYKKEILNESARIRKLTSLVHIQENNNESI